MFLCPDRFGQIYLKSDLNLSSEEIYNLITLNSLVNLNGSCEFCCRSDNLDPSLNACPKLFGQTLQLFPIYTILIALINAIYAILISLINTVYAIFIDCHQMKIHLIYIEIQVNNYFIFESARTNLDTYKTAYIGH